MLLLLLVAAQSNFASAQSGKKSGAEALKHHAYALSHDSLKGRDAATRYERSAAAYIADEFQQAGLQPFFGDTSFFQEFPLRINIEMLIGNKLIINNRAFVHNLDFYTLLYGASGRRSGCIVLSDTPPDSCIWMLRLEFPRGYSDSLLPAKNNFILDLLDTAKAHGITAVILVGDTDSLDYQPLRLVRSRGFSDIPAVFMQSDALRRIDMSAGMKGEIRTHFYRPDFLTALNVAGFIDNKAEKTVVIGAHYDHVGLGYYGSLGNYAGKVHYGADDNASGTAALLELARGVKESGLKNYNYLFIAFSAEEKGLLGSQYFVNSPDGQKLSYNCMLNADMIGRLRPDEKGLILVTLGSSRSWKKLARKSNPEDIPLTFKRTTWGRSDNYNFRDAGIPAVHFFTGLHPDYHTPRDLPETLDYEGMQKVVNLIHAMLLTIDNKPPLKFRKPFIKSEGMGL